MLTDITSYLVQLLDATAYMHKNNVVHRDLKVSTQTALRTTSDH